MLELVFLTVGAISWTVRFDFVPRYCGARMHYGSDCMGMIGPLGLCSWRLALSVGLFRGMEDYDVNPALGLLALA